MSRYLLRSRDNHKYVRQSISDPTDIVYIDDPLAATKFDTLKKAEAFVDAFEGNWTILRLDYNLSRIK